MSQHESANIQNDPGARSEDRHHDAYESLMYLLDRIGESDVESIFSKDYPVLIASHALITTLEIYGERITNALEEIAGYADFLTGHLASKNKLTLMAGESELIVAALKAAWLKLHPIHDEAEYIEAIRRIEILAGL